MAYQGRKQPVHVVFSCHLPTALCVCSQSALHATTEVFIGQQYAALLSGVFEKHKAEICRYDSPLKPVTSRLLHVGDSAGNRSALSFAGACAAGSGSALTACIFQQQCVRGAVFLCCFMHGGKFDFLRSWLPCSHMPPEQPLQYLNVSHPRSMSHQSVSSSGARLTGFGAMARHLQRLTDGLERALDGGLVGRGALALLQPRSPAISMTNAMQQTMGTRAHQVLLPQSCPQCHRVAMRGCSCCVHLPITCGEAPAIHYSAHL